MSYFTRRIRWWWYSINWSPFGWRSKRSNFDSFNFGKQRHVSDAERPQKYNGAISFSLRWPELPKIKLYCLTSPRYVRNVVDLITYRDVLCLGLKDISTIIKNQHMLQDSEQECEREVVAHACSRSEAGLGCSVETQRSTAGAGLSDGLRQAVADDPERSSAGARSWGGLAASRLPVCLWCKLKTVSK